ncbi:MAG: S8 family serine peptidase [Candidatus Brockarchaeota archaeon]|nr:S8 family serine peptidase [Candidatus Brockarchaeota archaeon]
MEYLRIEARQSFKKVFAVILVSIFVLSTIPFVEATPPEKVAVIVGFKREPNPQLIRSYGGEVNYVYRYILAIAASLPPSAIDALKKNPNVAYVEPDYEAHIIPLVPLAKPAPPTQPPETTPWGIEKIGAPKVWSEHTGAGVKVAVLDTGIDLTHPDLKVAGGATFVTGTKSYNDDNGHGTHVAGIIAALDNEIGVVGVAPGASLYAVKVLNKQGSGFISWIIAGIEWSIDNGMQIISMSFGSTADSTALHDELKAAYGKGIVLVAAAGNNGPGENTITYPAKYPEVIAVGATDENDYVAEWSSRGPELELTAPGVNIYSTYKGGSYRMLSGTSMACPHVTGTVALILSKNPSLSPDEVRDILQKTAIDLGSSGQDSTYGYGRVDAYTAVTATPTPPT